MACSSEGHYGLRRLVFKPRGGTQYGGYPILGGAPTPPPVVTPRNIWWGCAARFSKSWPYRQTKISNFSEPFFQTWGELHNI